MRSGIKQLTQRLENFEKHQKMQDSQIAPSVSRAHSTFPGKSDLNPVEHCNRIKLRSGCTVGGSQITTQKELESEKEPSVPLPNRTQNRDGEEAAKKVEETLQIVPHNQTIPFPHKLIATQKDEEFNRRQKGDFETVALTENYSALLMANSPPKPQDPGSFSLPCRIGPELIPRAFCDLGASVSLLPYSLYKKLGL
ncbi:uncharacterized protein LOC122026472 [Zingiber officinale]|uniref:uncharacterized protein LOC122026472 n=1 Tax=Zingiber officinale TaxID=94328 RepID=UPI001C4CDEC3|nr:uncharacterized protein LOC122026472 [Zingiber officinale]